MAIGNPLGLSSTATTGVVSALNRPVTTSAEGGQQQGEQVVTNAIQTDAAVNPGNSGGALVDSGGRVIGITSSIASLGAAEGAQAGNIGLGFAIPANEAKDVAQQLISTGDVKHAYLGVTLGDGTATVDGAQRAAAVVGTVTSGSPAAKAGLQAKDAIVAVGGQRARGRRLPRGAGPRPASRRDDRPDGRPRRQAADDPPHARHAAGDQRLIPTSEPAREDPPPLLR